MNRTRSAAHFGLVVVVVIWGINFSVVKAVLAVIDPLLLNGLRFLIAGSVLWLFVRGAGLPTLAREDAWRIILLGLIGNTAYQLAFLFGLDGTRAGNGAIILASAPIWTVGMSVLAGQDEGSFRLLATTILGALGIGLVFSGSGQSVAIDASSLEGDVLVAVSSVCWAAYTVAGRPLVQRYGALPVTAWALWIGGTPLVLLAIPDALATDWSRVSASVWGGVLFASLGAVALAYLLWYRAVETIGTASTALWSNMVPGVALFVAWVWLGERPTLVQLVGTAMILTSVAVVRRRARPAV